MAIAQMPEGTRRHGIGDRPFQSYSIVKVDGDKETQIGLTKRVEEDGKTVGWKAENGKATSPVQVTHRDAVIWLVDGPAKPEPKKAAKAPAKAAAKPAAKTPAKAPAPKSPGKAPTGQDGSGPEAGGSQDAPSDLTAALAASVKAA
jgi:hypothetical protein